MPLMPFKLFNNETRLIVHNECLYKLKLSYKPELSLMKAPSSQRNEVNRELTKVIRAVLFMIQTEKHIPHKIHIPSFTVNVAVKFWKIALKLGFSKNGSRLKCGHLIELTLCKEENRIQEKEGSKLNTKVNDNNKYCLEKKAENRNIELFNHMGLREFVINSDDSDSECGASSECIVICSSPENSIPAANECNNAVPMVIDSENFRIPESQLNQAKSSAQTPMISDQTVQALSDSAQMSNELPHSLHPPKEASTSNQVLPVFISSCTQTDPDELDSCANIPNLNSRTLVKAAVSHVQSDHDYLKSLTNNHTESTMSKEANSDSNKESIHLQEDRSLNIDQRPPVVNLNTSLHEDDINSVGGGRDDVDDDDNNPGRSRPEEVSGSAEVAKAAQKLQIETLNAEQGDVLVDTLSKPSHNDHQDKNDVWGIESRQLDIVSEVEIPMEPQSRSHEKDIGKSYNLRHPKKKQSADHSEEEAIQNKNSPNTERTKSPSQERQSDPSKNPVKPTGKSPQMAHRSRSRMRTLRSYKKASHSPDQKVRNSKSSKKLPQRQVCSSLGKKTTNKRTCEKQPLPSDSNKGEKRSKQEHRTPEVQTEISYGLHDRYQVQTQELQEDLKLQNLAHPSSTSTDRKRRSFLEYINFSYFLRGERKKN